MASLDFILFAPPAPDMPWRIGVSSGTEVVMCDVLVTSNIQMNAAAALLSDALRQQGYRGSAITLAIPSAWCMAANVSLADLPKHDTQALLYRLEEQLPLPAESLVADFVLSTDRALGVCSTVEKIQPWVQALEPLGIPVQSIAPATFLAAQTFAGTTEKPFILLLAEESSGVAEAMINVIVIQDQKPISWSLVQARIETLSLEIEVLTTASPRPLRWQSVGMGTALVDAMTQLLGPQFVEQDPSLTPAKAATQSGAATLAGRIKPWVELRQGSLAAHDPRRLHRRALNALLASAAIGLLAVNGAMILRAGRYDAQARSSERKMLDGFHAAFPGWTTPANVRVLLESEHRKLLKATSAGNSSQPAGSALQTLASVLGRLPADLPVRVDRMTFNDDSFELQGRVRSYEDVGALAIAARGGGLDVPTPQARRETDGYWSFVVRGNAPNRPANGAPAKQSANVE